MSESPTPQWPPPTPKPKTWTQRHQNVLIVIGVIVGMVVFGAIKISADNKRRNEDDSQTCHSIVYTIDASGPVAVTFTTQSGDTSQQDVDDGKFSTTFCADVGAFVYVSGQVQGENGRVSCRITSSGKVIATNQSSGDYVIASCSGDA